MSPSKRKNRVVRWARAILLLAGLAGVGAWMVSAGSPAVWQQWEWWKSQHPDIRAYVSELWSRAARRIGLEPAEPVYPAENSSPVLRSQHAARAPAPNALLGRLTIPRLGLSTTVREGTSEGTLFLAAGHIRGTSLPGQPGNAAVAAHRDTLFSALGEVRMSDRIQFENIDGKYTYEVRTITVVKPDDVSVLKAGRTPELTLVTCYPFDYIGSAPDRFVVKARQISRNPGKPVLMPTVQPQPVERQSQVVPQPQVAESGADLPTPVPTRGTIVSFWIAPDHSRQLAPGISLGVTRTDGHDMDGWMWIMPDRRTVWLRQQEANEPVVFYQNGERRRLLLTRLTANSVTGYVSLKD